MSLQVWLPLTGDLHNQGLSNVNITNTSATINNSGKIGKCYSFGTAKSYFKFDNVDFMHNFSECSVSLWINILTWNTSYATYFQFGLGNTPWAHYIFGLLRNNAASTLCFTISNGSSATNANCLTPALELNTWYHLTLTYTNGHCKIYVNGENTKDYSTTIVPNFSGITTGIIGACNNGSNYQTNCLMNDFRIYNHCLSDKEVEEIAKGLIVHYKCNQNFGTGANLIKNGFGELGNEYWSAAGSTTDIPDEDSNIKASFPSSGNSTDIPIVRNTTYKIEAWIKATATSGNTYPSLYPYDIDGKFINNYNSKVGFNLNTMTTITQVLNPGDTEIHVASLANWNASSGTNYNYAAIFSYKDSTGYIYPDGTYTQNTPAFGSGTTEKTNLDKTNNVITLNTSYNGPIIPIGTAICAATAGSTYFYPLGGIACSGIQDWTYRTNTFSSEDERLLAAATVRFHIYSKSRMAGIKITNISLLDNSNIFQDSSGLQNNGIISGTLTSENNSPRYNLSTYFNGSSYVLTPVGNMGWNDLSELTLSCWMYPTASMTGWRGSWGIATDTTYIARGFAITDYGNEFRVTYTNGSTYVTLASGKTLTQNEWHHCAATLKDTTVKMYFDGELVKTYTLNWGTATLNTNARIELGVDLPGSDEKFTGNYSDARLYVTALTAEQILDLYHTSASIDKDGNVYAREIIE